MSYPINVIQVPVAYWRQGTEYTTAGCGVVPGPQGYQANGAFPCYTNWLGITEKWDEWRFAYPEKLTHIFGNISSDTTTYPYGKLEPPLVGRDQKMNSDYRDFFAGSNSGNYGQFISKTRPNLASITYDLPDPKKDIDIDSTIPNILAGYAKENKVSKESLKDYLSKYLFTKVTGKDGKKYGRVEFINKPELSKNPRLYNKAYLETLITNWNNTDIASFQEEGGKYCSGTTFSLDKGWCYNACSTSNPSKKPYLTCDSNLKTFCQAPDLDGGFYQDPDSQIKIGDSSSKIISIFPNSYNAICGGFMTPNYYAAMDLASTKGDAGGAKVVNQLVAQNFYKNPMCTSIGTAAPVKTAEWYANPGGCPALTVCLNQVNINNQGNLSNAKLNIKQANNCGPGASDPGGESFFQKNKIAIIVASIITVLTLIMLFTLI
jgi:hypothetical protein